MPHLFDEFTPTLVVGVECGLTDPPTQRTRVGKVAILQGLRPERVVGPRSPFQHDLSWFYDHFSVCEASWRLPDQVMRR